MEIVIYIYRIFFFILIVSIKIGNKLIGVILILFIMYIYWLVNEEEDENVEIFVEDDFI